jgi:hypothetical protein
LKEKWEQARFTLHVHRATCLFPVPHFHEGKAPSLIDTDSTPPKSPGLAQH